jgi:CBS domain-containing protein
VNARFVTELRVHDLASALKPSSPLSPDESLAKAARLLRARQLPGLVVARDRQLVGIIYEADLLALAAGATEAPALMRATRVEQVMRPVGLVLSLHEPLDHAARAMQETGFPLAPVAGSDGGYLGVLLRRDVLAAISGEPVLTQIAGLATPFGVHLTTGSRRAGASDLALASTGAALMVMNLLAVNGVEWLRVQLHRAWPALAALTPRNSTGEWVEAIVTGLVSLVVFLLLLRLSPVTGIHAAEHMVVHALEEGEDLTLEKVRTQPRVHPRCGTNLVALLVLVGIGQSLLGAISRADEAAGVLALFGLVVVVVITWRRLGHGLQRWITTKRPSDRQLAKAIRVGEELLEKAARPIYAKPLRRLWNSGFLQVLAGFLVVLELAHYAPALVAQVFK